MSILLKEDIETIYLNTKKISKSLKGKTILITGGNGFLGKYFVELFKKYNQFSKKKIKILVYDNNLKKNFNEPSNNIRFIKHDVSNKIITRRKIDIIIHAAGIASPYYYRKKPIQTLDVAINGTRNCLEIAKKNNSKFIFFSSSEIYGDPHSEYVPTKETYRGNVSTLGPRACYDESKRLGETLCYIYNNYYKIHTNIIRPFNVYGPGMGQYDYRIFPNFISNALNNKKINIYGSGNQTRTYCYITDAIEGFIRIICLGKPGEAYNIGNNKPEVSVKDVFSIFKKIYANKIKVNFINHPKSYPNDEPQRRCPDLNKSNKHLNYKPKIKLNDGLKKYLDWAKVHYRY
jgi:UDP-glucuronate decarboxylase